MEVAVEEEIIRYGVVTHLSMRIKKPASVPSTFHGYSYRGGRKAGVF